jgi:hypothetical protein
VAKKKKPAPRKKAAKKKAPSKKKPPARKRTSRLSDERIAKIVEENKRLRKGADRSIDITRRYLYETDKYYFEIINNWRLGLIVLIGRLREGKVDNALVVADKLHGKMVMLEDGLSNSMAQHGGTADPSVRYRIEFVRPIHAEEWEKEEVEDDDEANGSEE